MHRQQHTLILSSGGIRQITLLQGCFMNNDFNRFAKKCDTILGTSAGALMGFIISAAENPEKLQRLRYLPGIHFKSYLTILCDVLINRDIVRQTELRGVLTKALNIVQPRHDGLVELHQNLIVGYVKHEGFRSRYCEESLAKGIHRIRDILPKVLGSASICGITSSDITDGGQMHAFPIRTYRKNEALRKSKTFVVSPYPMVELLSPTYRDNDGFVGKLKQLIDGVSYGSMMERIGEDVQSVALGDLKLHKHDRYATLYGYKNVHVVCPIRYTASDKVFSITGAERRTMLAEGHAMAGLIAGETMPIRL